MNLGQDIIKDLIFEAESQIKTVVAIIMVTASFVGMYYTLQADIEEAKKLHRFEFQPNFY